MRAFRLSHAGVVLETEGRSLVIDPGSFSAGDELSAALTAALPVAGLVITHEHADHWTPDTVAAVRAAAPDAPIFTTAATASALAAAGFDGVTIVVEGDTARVGPFRTSFYGHRHEVLHASIPVIENVGVRVNDVFAYGGDDLTRPPFRADLLGVPIGSPWSNLAQVMDFVLKAAPRRAYLTHDGMLSSAGLGLFRSRVEWCLTQVGGALVELPRIGTDPGARFDLARAE